MHSTAIDRRSFVVAGVLAISACSALGPEDPSLPAVGEGGQEVTSALLTSRSNAIKAVHASHPLIHNPVLFAGIAYTETNMAHCFAEYASQVSSLVCAGPTSVDCGGAVTAGFADNPGGNCALQGGGLGMWQFDEGNYTQTLNKWNTTGYWNGQTHNILSIADSTSAAIDFILFKAWNSSFTPAFANPQAMYSWINGIRPVNGNADYELWLGFLSNSYNGQPWGSAGWSTVKEQYRASTTFVFNAMGGNPYWYGTGGGGGGTPFCSASCGGGGWWCSGDGACIQNGVAGHNYHCPGNNTAPDVDQACGSGCVVAPAGTPVYCRPAGFCGSGQWCGNDCVGGFARTLYNFSSTGAVIGVTQCQVGFVNRTCVTATAGNPDFCN